MKYRLSNRQQKELVIRGQELTIVIPAAPDIGDPIDYVLDSLPELPDYMIEVSAAVELVPVRPAQKAYDPACDTLVDIVGSLDPPEDEQGVVVWINAVVAVLNPPRCRGTVRDRHWPGFLLS